MDERRDEVKEGSKAGRLVKFETVIRKARRIYEGRWRRDRLPFAAGPAQLVAVLVAMSLFTQNCYGLLD